MGIETLGISVTQSFPSPLLPAPPRFLLPAVEPRAPSRLGISAIGSACGYGFAMALYADR